jgi:hypothetical protein
MDDTFTFVAPVMPRRRVDPFALKLAVAAALFVAFVGLFGAFVIGREHASDAARDAKAQALAAADRAQIEAAAAQAEAAGAGTEAGLADAEARDLLGRALVLAQGFAAGGTDLAEAGPIALTSAEPTILFVDGPSTAPSIVSVDAVDGLWGAAVMGPSGTCYLVRLDADGEVARQLGGRCSGEAALSATGDGW